MSRNSTGYTGQLEPRRREFLSLVATLLPQETHDILLQTLNLFQLAIAICGKKKNENKKKRNSCYIKDTLYNSLSSKNKEAKLLLLKKVGISVCPYCNRNYIFSNENVITCQLDHFFSKEKYPILAVSFFNLIPCCSTCNRLKGTNDFDFYPYDQKNKAIDIMRFSYKPINSDFLRVTIQYPIPKT